MDGSEAESAVHLSGWGLRSRWTSVPRLNLALQGGGAHGAFTWGVLDRLLRDDRVRIDTVSGASAGAVNAVALAAGLAGGGEETARALLEAVWRDVATSARTGALMTGALPGMPVDEPRQGLHQMALGVFTRLFSPYQFNPFDLNPLRTILARRIDFDLIRRQRRLRLLIAATDVETGRPRLFGADEISVDAVLASCCLPHLFQAIRVGDRHYWDGGYSANPPLLSLIRRASAADTLIVQIAREVEPEVPTSARRIADRLHQLVFNGPLRMELETIALAHRFGRKVLSLGEREVRRIVRHRLHRIVASDHYNAVGALSMLAADWSSIRMLRDHGRAAMDSWLTEHVDSVGRRSTIDLAQLAP